MIFSVIGYVKTNLKNKIKDTNDDFLTMIGKEKEDILGKNIGCFVNVEKKEIINGEIYERAEVVTIKNGKEIVYFISPLYISISRSPILNATIKGLGTALLLVEANDNRDVVYSTDNIRQMGFEKEQVVGGNLLNLVKRKEILKLRNALDKSSRKMEVVEQTFVSFDGPGSEEKRIEAVIHPIGNLSDEVIYWAVVLRLEDEDKKVARREQYFDSLFDTNPDMVFSIDRNYMIEDVNEAILKKLELKSNDLRGHSIAKLFPDDQFDDITKVLMLIKDTGENSKEIFSAPERFGEEKDRMARGYPLKIDEFLMLKKTTNSREFIPVRMSFSPVLSDNVVQKIYVVAKDITESKHNEMLIWEYAYWDRLTNLPNRRSFEKRISNLKFKNEHPEEYDTFSLMFLDVDDFGQINDRYNHKVGDQVLIKVTSIIREVVGKVTKDIYRISGDEFVMIFMDKNNENIGSDMALELKRRFKKRVDIPGLGNLKFRVSASMGIARHPDDCDNLNDVIRFADLALGHSKNEGKDMYTRYNHQFLEEGIRGDATKEMIQRGIERDEFELHYQPIVEYGTNKIKFLEALVRWRHPEWGMTFPNRFIEIAEETNMITKLGFWVLTAACEQIAEWREKGQQMFPISVNVSGKQLKRPNFHPRVKQRLEKYDIPPEYLIIEVTESIAIEKDPIVGENFKELRKMGCKIAIDDFGTGHSSIGYLNEFKTDYLKLDKSFTFNIQNDERLEKIVRAIIDLSEALEIKVIAEGVEIDMEAKTLTKIGSDYLQGFYYARPKANKDLLHIITDNNKIIINGNET